MRTLFAIAVLLAATALAEPARAQRAGQWEVPRGGYIDPAGVVGSRDEAAAVAQLDRLIEQVRRIPALARPLGADVVTQRTVEHYPLGGPRAREDLVRSGLTVMLHELLPDGTRSSHYQASIDIRINPTFGLPGLTPVARDSAGEMFRMEPHGATTAGWPTWLTDGLITAHWRRIVLLAPRDVPVTVPVTRERWLTHRIRDAEGVTRSFGTADERCARWRAEAPQRAEALRAAVAAIGASDPAAARQLQQDMARIERETEQMMCGADGVSATAARQVSARADSIRRELQALSPAERQAQAWLDVHDRLQAPGTAGAHPIVSINPRLYGPGIGVDPHVIVVDMKSMRGLAPLLERAFREFDWAQLAAMMRTPRNP